MIIAIDDSGGPGLKPGKGVSSYFAIAAIYFRYDEDAERVRDRIKQLKVKLGWKGKREFKFRKDRPEIKKKFLATVKNEKFVISAVLLEKSKIHKREYYKNSGKLYNTTMLEAIHGLNIQLDKAHIYIDGESGTDYRKKVKTFFRQSLPKGAVRELSYENSVDDPLIQLADMVVGAIRYTLEDKKDANDYIKIIKKHIVSLKSSI